MKNSNEKLAILLLQAKDDKVLIVAGSKNTNIKAGDWIKNIAPIVGGGGGEDLTSLSSWWKRCNKSWRCKNCCKL